MARIVTPPLTLPPLPSSAIPPHLPLLLSPSSQPQLNQIYQRENQDFEMLLFYCSLGVRIPSLQEKPHAHPQKRPT